MLTPAEAEAQVLAHVAAFPTEECPLAEAHGRVLRQPIKADRDLPPFDRVTLDGYALRAASLAAGVTSFRVAGVQAAGMRPFELGPGPDACVEIMTGAVLSTGADCVVPYEETRREGDRVTIEAGGRFAAGHAIHAAGSDFPAGKIIVPAGVRLTAREIAVAASCGAAVLPVSRRPKIAVVSTGDELVDVDAIVAPHQVRRSNDYALRAALVAAGWPQVDRFHFHDMRHEIEHQLWHILAEVDVVLLTGGVSKGKFDHLPAALETLGVRKIFHGVAQRPGKPFWFGQDARRKSVFALPGNPVSAYTCLHRYVLPALDRASGLAGTPPRPIRLAEAVRFAPPLACLMPVKLRADAAGGQVAVPAPTNTSGDFASLVGTDGFVELPAAQDDFPAGYVAPYRAWC